MDKFESLPVITENLKSLIHQMKGGKDGNTLIMTSHQGIHIYKVQEQTHALVKTPRPVYLLDVDAGGKIVASAPQGEVYLYREGEERKTLKVWNQSVLHASRPSFSPDGTQLVLGRHAKDREKTIAFIVNSENGKALETRSNVTHTAWNRRAGLAFVEGEGEKKSIQIINDERAFSVPAPQQANCLDFSPDGNYLFWCKGGEAVIFDIDHRKERLVWKAINEAKADIPVRITVTRDNQRAAIGTLYGAIILVSQEDGRELFRIGAPTSPAYVSGMVFLNNEKWLAATRLDGSLNIYEIPG